MHSRLRRRIIEILLAAALATGTAGAEEFAWTLSAADWSRPRSGTAVLDMAPVAEALRAWRKAAEEGVARILLVHAGGEEGSLWAAELRDWLVALGVPPDAVELAPGSQSADHLEIRVEVR